MPPRFVARPPGLEPDAPGPLVATGRPLRWGVVATGGIARTVTAQLVQLEDAVLHAVSSRDLERARAFADEHGAPAAYGDDGEPGYVHLAADPDVEVVYVATPHGQHFEVTRALLEAGKHVLVEKAFTINAREAEALIDLARSRGAFLMEAVWTRFTPGFQRAQDAIEAGEIGDVKWVQADFGFRAGDDDRSRLWAPEAGGGALLDLTVYPFTWAFAALGAPAGVHASGTLTTAGVDAMNALTLTYEDGAHAQILSSLTAHTSRTATIGGTEGTLRTAAGLCDPPAFTVTRADGAREAIFESDVPRYAPMLREVTRCVQEGRRESPTMPLADTLVAMRAFDEARRQLGVRYPNDAASETS